jgi:hypothetical protein
MSTRSRRASNASDTSQEASQAVDGAALGAQLAALSAAVKEIADQQSKDREAAKALEAERAAAVAAAAKQAEEQAKQAEAERASRGEDLRGESGRDRAARVDGAGGSERAGGGASGVPGVDLRAGEGEGGVEAALEAKEKQVEAAAAVLQKLVEEKLALEGDEGSARVFFGTAEDAELAVAELARARGGDQPVVFPYGYIGGEQGQYRWPERLIQADERVKTGLQFPHPSIALVPSAVEFADLLPGYELLPKGSQEELNYLYPLVARLDDVHRGLQALAGGGGDRAALQAAVDEVNMLEPFIQDRLWGISERALVLAKIKDPNGAYAAFTEYTSEHEVFTEMTDRLARYKPLRFVSEAKRAELQEQKKEDQKARRAAAQKLRAKAWAEGAAKKTHTDASGAGGAGRGGGAPRR